MFTTTPLIFIESHMVMVLKIRCQVIQNSGQFIASKDLSENFSAGKIFKDIPKKIEDLLIDFK